MQEFLADFTINNIEIYINLQQLNRGWYIGVEAAEMGKSDDEGGEEHMPMKGRDDNVSVYYWTDQEGTFLSIIFYESFLSFAES